MSPRWPHERRVTTRDPTLVLYSRLQRTFGSSYHGVSGSISILAEVFFPLSSSAGGCSITPFLRLHTTLLDMLPRYSIRAQRSLSKTNATLLEIVKAQPSRCEFVSRRQLPHWRPSEHLDSSRIYFGHIRGRRREYLVQKMRAGQLKCTYECACVV